MELLNIGEGGKCVLAPTRCQFAETSGDAADFTHKYHPDTSSVKALPSILWDMTKLNTLAWRKYFACEREKQHMFVQHCI